MVKPARQAESEWDVSESTLGLIDATARLKGSQTETRDARGKCQMPARESLRSFDATPFHAISANSLFSALELERETGVCESCELNRHRSDLRIYQVRRGASWRSCLFRLLRPLFFSTRTKQLFAWPIAPPMIFLAAAIYARSRSHHRAARAAVVGVAHRSHWRDCVARTRKRSRHLHMTRR